MMTNHSDKPEGGNATMDRSNSGEISGLGLPSARLGDREAAASGEQEEAISSLSASGRLQLYSNETPFLVGHGIRLLLRAVESLPEEEKKAFEEAVRAAPNVAQNERDLVLFLRRDGYNVSAAARRMASYWRHRVALFGERTFLPMTLTGEGALNKRDVEELKTGFLSLLMKNDSSSCVEKIAVFEDETIRPCAEENLDSELALCWARCRFYMLSAAAVEANEAKAQGLDWICYTGKGDMTAPLSRIETLVDVMPIKVESVHLCGRLAADANLMQRQHCVEANSAHNTGPVVCYHTAATALEVGTHLRVHGFQLEQLPTCVGGSLSPSYAECWMEGQAARESQLLTELAAKPRSTAAAPTERENEGTKECMKPRKRKKRRKTELQREEFEDLRAQIIPLTELNLRLGSENLYLQAGIRDMMKVKEIRSHLTSNLETLRLAHHYKSLAQAMANASFVLGTDVPRASSSIVAPTLPPPCQFVHTYEGSLTDIPFTTPAISATNEISTGKRMRTETAHVPDAQQPPQNLERSLSSGIQ